MNQYTLNTINYLLLYRAAFSIGLLYTDNGVCSIKNRRGNSIFVCCPDFEEIYSTCTPCLDGYTSEIGKQCQPCPRNTFGHLCINKCYCTEFQRCNHIFGCVNLMTQESSTEVDQTTTLSQKDFTTVSSFATGSNLVTLVYAVPGKNIIRGLLLRETIVYLTLSAGLVILIICLCVVVIRYKREHNSRTVPLGISDQAGRTIENSEQHEIEDTRSYEEIDVLDINVEPELIMNDYFEVNTEFVNSNRNTSEDDNQHGYLNPYMPFVLKDDLKYSYKRLEFQLIVATCNSDKSNVIGNETHQSTMLTSYENEHYCIENTAQPDKGFVKGIQQNDTEKAGNIEESFEMTTSATFENMSSSISCCNLRKNMFSNSSASQKYPTF